MTVVLKQGDGNRYTADGYKAVRGGGYSGGHTWWVVTRPDGSLLNPSASDLATVRRVIEGDRPPAPPPKSRAPVTDWCLDSLKVERPYPRRSAEFEAHVTFNGRRYILVGYLLDADRINPRAGLHSHYVHPAVYFRNILVDGKSRNHRCASRERSQELAEAFSGPLLIAKETV